MTRYASTGQVLAFIRLMRIRNGWEPIGFAALFFAGIGMGQLAYLAPPDENNLRGWIGLWMLVFGLGLRALISVRLHIAQLEYERLRPTPDPAP